LFAPVQRIETRVFARLPDALRIKGRRSGWAFGKGNDHLHSFLEGPCFDRGGNLYVTDIPYGRILRVTRDATWSVVTEYDGWPNGLAIHRDGRIFIADHKRGILALDVAKGRVEPVLENVRRESFKGTNDLTFASNGDLYFTDQGQTGLQDPSGRVFRLRTDGNVDCLIGNVPSPNGLVLSKDEKTLFLAVTRANQVWRLPLHPDGTTSKVGAFINMSGGSGPDGMALADDGSIAVAHVGHGSVWIFDRLGEPRYRLVSCEDLTVTNIAFGGSAGKTLFITESESGTILCADTDVAGHRLYSHA
jgi:gluconolactonase